MDVLSQRVEGLLSTQRSLGLIVGLVGLWLARSYYRQRKVWVDVPVVGASGFLSSYIAAVKFMTTGRGLVEDGYAKYKGQPFQAAERNHWHVFFTSPKSVDELRKFPDEVLSADIAADEHLKAQFTIGPTVISNPYHVAALKNFNKSLATHFLDLVEEMKSAIPEYFPEKVVNGKAEWVPVNIFNTSLPFVCRTSNRTFVGDVCRHPDWININIKYTLDVVIGAQIISLFPNFLQPFVGRYLTTAPRRRAQAAKILGPIIEERYKVMEEEGKETPNIPNDFLKELMELAIGDEKKPANLTLRILALNTAAIHTSALTLTRTLFLLAAYPEFIEPLREEARRVISEEGWTKQAMNNLVRLDSLIKEGLRFNPGAVVNIDRTPMKDITLADGTLLPKGAFVSIAMGPLMRDKAIYGDDADKFDPFRFSDRRSQGGGDNRNQLVMISPEFLAFGMGKRACPGRFLASAELKAMLSYILLHYDFKYPDGQYKHGETPPEKWFGTVSAPSDTTELLFRKRECPL